MASTSLRSVPLPFRCPYFTAACHALAWVEQIAVSLPPDWNHLAESLRRSASAVMFLLARARAFRGKRRLALQRVARIRAFELSSHLMASDIIGGPHPSEAVKQAAIGYTALVRALRASAL